MPKIFPRRKNRMSYRVPIIIFAVEVLSISVAAIATNLFWRELVEDTYPQFLGAWSATTFSLCFQILGGFLGTELLTFAVVRYRHGEAAVRSRVENFKIGLIVYLLVFLVYPVTFLYQLNKHCRQIRNEAENQRIPTFCCSPKPRPEPIAPTDFEQTILDKLAAIESEQGRRSASNIAAMDVGEYIGKSAAFVGLSLGPSPQITHPVFINVGAFIGLINHGGATRIEDIQGRALVGKQWVPLERVDTRGLYMIFAAGDPRHLPSVNASKFLDRELADKVLKTGDSAFGWVMFRCQCNVYPGKVQITLTDSDGNKVRAKTLNSNLQASNLIVDGRQTFDLSSFVTKSETK